MTKLLLIFLLLNNYVLHSQVSEIGLHLGFGGFSEVQMNDGTSSQKPTFFPVPDSLMKMNYEQNGTVTNFPVGLNYTRWRPTLIGNRLDQGISGSFGFGGRVVNTENWNTIDTVTYDTLIVQGSGTKYPIDSFITDVYSMKTVGSAMRFTLGYHYRFNASFLDLVLGADLVLQRYAGQRKDYRYYKYGTTNMPEFMLSDSIGASNGLVDPVFVSKIVQLKHFSWGIQFPFELRFHRREDHERKSWMWAPEDMGVLGIQVTPGVYYLNFNGIDKYYGSCSLGFNWVFEF